ncbi:MAG: DUF1788 domain-containing protein [Bacteroidales bacterium]|nr:DUF1788 domain-containing protein [Bacteroidales bacterium]
MSTSLKYNTPEQFNNLYKILSSPRFLKKEGLGGELPFFIHSFPVNKQSEVETGTESLLKRLQSEGIEILEVNLYLLCMDILKREEIFDKIVAQEQSWTNKQRLLRILSGPLHIDTAIIPEIHRRLADSNAKILLLTGIGAAFPFVRSHTILNNLQTLVGDIPLVMFFPGTYNNISLNLFDRIIDNNYYRAHNLNEYKI